MADKNQDHNKGEQDRSKHENAGWVNHDLGTNYSPPPGKDRKEAYDKGWRNTGKK